MTIKNLYPSVLPSLNLDFANSRVLDPRVSFTRASASTYVGSDGLIKTAATNEPRFDHNPATRESLGLLVEEQRTNLLTYSEDFTNAAWAPLLSATTGNVIAAPNGATTADKLVSGSGSQGQITHTTAMTASTVFTYSVFAKKAEWDFLLLRLKGNDGVDSGAYFNLTTGTIDTTESDNTATIQNFGNGWYRCSITRTSGSGATTTRQRLIPTNAKNTWSTGDGTSGIYLWGAQLEAGAFPTSYSPTTSAAATRAADVAQITGTNFSSWYRQDEGTVLVSATTNATHRGSNSFPRKLTVSDGTNNNSIEDYYRVTGSYTDTGYRVDTAGVSQAQFDTNNQRNSQTSVIGYAANNFAFAVGGTVNNTDSFGTVPTTTSLRLGQRMDGSMPLNGTIRRLVYWPQRLPNSTLQAITQ